MRELSEIGINIPSKTFVIAEIGINHGGDIDIAKKLIDSAARTGAHSVKFQTYITEKRTHVGSPIFDILKKCELSFDSFKVLKKYSEDKGLIFFSTPFDTESIDFLDSIDCPIYKIASFDVLNHPFLEKVASLNKPIILSVGMSDMKEIKNAVEVIRKQNDKLAILHCISSYPTNEKDANLGAVQSLITGFPSCVIGQSDHTNDIYVPALAVASGARILEKHYKIDAEMDCIDGPVSITEIQMKNLVDEVLRIEAIMGDGIPALTKAQKDIEQYRRKPAK